MARSWSVRLFPVLGIPLEMHLSFLLLFVFFGTGGYLEAGVLGALWAIAFVFLAFACVVLHELGHCVVAQAYHISISRILLLPIGGMAQFADMPREPKKEFLITLGGPLVNFLIALLLFLVIGPPRLDMTMTADFMRLPDVLLVFNLVMGVFNLIPVFPMDGGRLVRAALAWKMDYAKATRMAVWIARPIGVAGILLALWGNNWLLALLFLFIMFAGTMELRMTERRELLSGVSVWEVTRKGLTMLDEGTPVRHAMEVMRGRGNEEVFVSRQGQLAGMVTPTGLLSAYTQDTERTLGTLEFKRPVILQAEAQLEPYTKILMDSPQVLFPVHSHGGYLGVLDSSILEQNLKWSKISRVVKNAQRREPPPIPSFIKQQ